MARRVVCLLCVGFLVVLALQQCATNVQKQSATVDLSSSSLSSSPPPLPLEKNLVPILKGRTMGPNNLDTFRDTKRRVPNGPDPIHNRRAGKSGQPPGRQ